MKRAARHGPAGAGRARLARALARAARAALVPACLLAPLPAGAETLIPASGSTMTESAALASFSEWLRAFRERALDAGISAATHDREMRRVERLEEVIRRDRNQDEFTRTIWDYLDIAVSEARIRMGREALARHAERLARIEAEYGVPKEIVAAVWGLESSFGTHRGTIDTLSALATLAHDGRRGAFFEAQLIEALRILDKGETVREAMVGSWAGAMGHTQFMPTSWAEFAVDFDGDGRRDIWGEDPTDALASTARFLAAHGWQKGLAWGAEVILPEGFDLDLTSERIRKPTADWIALGIRSASGRPLPQSEASSILLPAGASGPAFLITPNFQVIESYNPADAYVIAIGHLADRLAGGEPIRQSWPRHWRALTLAERKELQARLAAAGFDSGGVDGRIGPRTVAAVKAWQRAHGLPTDGYASPDLLDGLRAEARQN